MFNSKYHKYNNKKIKTGIFKRNIIIRGDVSNVIRRTYKRRKETGQSK